MEQILKIESEQGFSETAKPTDFINSKLIDLIIPGNTGTYSLADSYINVNMELVNAANTATGSGEPATNVTDTALYNNEIVYNGDLGGTHPSQVVPCSALVRNAEMFSANRGMVESIRRVNTLRQVLWNLENDKAEHHDGLDKIGTFNGRRGYKNQTSSFVQIIGSNVNNAGVADTDKKAIALTRDFRIPLSDLFGVGNASWNSDVFGDTRIHLEIEPNLLSIQQLGGQEGTESFDPNGADVKYGAMTSYDGAGLGQLANGADIGLTNPLVTVITYDEFQLYLPFYVGQAIQVTGNAGATGAFDVNAIISAVEYNLGTNGTNPPAGSQQVRIYTRTALMTNASGGPENVTAIVVKALLSDDTNDKIRFNRAEIVLSQKPMETGPDSIDYRTYSTEETQGVDQTSYNKQVIVEPNCQNLIVAHVPSGKTAPNQEWESYRLAIDNVDVCGNRDVPYAKPLHSDRILRFMNNRGQNVSNMSLRSLDTTEPQGALNQIPIFPILETMPLTQGEKIVNLELNSAGGAKDVIFFKELVRTI